MKWMLILVLIGFSSGSLFGQQQNKYSLQEAIDYGLKNNSGIRAAEYEVQSQSQLKKTSFDLPKTEVSLLYGQYNSYEKNDNNITVTQAIPFSSFGSRGKQNRELLESSELKKASTENDLILGIKQTYYNLAYSYGLRKLLMKEDSLFEEFFRAASLRYKAGETNLLEQTTAEVQRNDAKNRLRQNESDIIVLRTQLKSLLNTPQVPDITDDESKEASLSIAPDTAIISANPALAYLRQQIDVAGREKKLQQAKAAPDLLLGFFTQTLIGTANSETGTIANGSDRFTGFQVGISLPLWYGPHQGRIRAAEYQTRAAESAYISQRLNLSAQLEQAIQSFLKNRTSLGYYRASALPNADLILKQSQAGFQGGDIGYTEFLLGVRNAITIRENYLKTLNDYNQSVIYIEFLSGNKSK